MKMYNILLEFMSNIVQKCNFDPRLFTYPLKYEEPIYGSSEYNYGRFFTPGVINSMMFCFTAAITATLIIMEKLGGIWERTLTTGISNTEILISHSIVNSVIVLLHVVEVLFVALTCFNMTCVGEIYLLSFLLFLQGICGMWLGFLISVTCQRVSTAHTCALGGSILIIIGSGVLWPVQTMPDGLRHLSLLLPTTASTETARNIMERGWGLSNFSVVQGFLINIIWILFISALSICFLKRKH